MAEIKEVTVHCPKCLVEFEIKPVVKSITRQTGEGFVFTAPKVVIEFEMFCISHRCDPEREFNEDPS